MRVAVACDGLEVAPYFLHSSNFMIYTVERGKVSGSRNMTTADIPPAGYPDLLRTLEADTVIVGRIEYGVAEAMCRSGIEVVAGAAGAAGDVVRAYVNKTLSGVSEPCVVGEATSGSEFHVNDAQPQEA